MSSPPPSFRRDIIRELIPHAQADDRIVLLVCDMGFGVIDEFRDRFPGRVINCGIMEQGTVGIAAGMALTGLVPVVYSIVNFLVFRSLEQVRNDVVLQGLNVKFISTGVNDYFAFLGRSHCCGTDDIELMHLIGMDVFDPYAEPDTDFTAMVSHWIAAPRAGYIRV
jgi:transketolase